MEKVVALPLIPNVVFRIAVRTLQGPIVGHQSGDPSPQRLHFLAASLDAPELVLSYFAILCFSASAPLSFCSAIVPCCYMLGVGSAVIPLPIEKCFIVLFLAVFFRLFPTYVKGERFWCFLFYHHRVVEEL